MKKQRLFNQVVGSVAGVMGLMAFGAGLYMMVNISGQTAPIKKAIAHGELVSVNSCKASLENLNYHPMQEGRNFKIIDSAALTDSYNALATSSLAITMCQGYRLQDFCMGYGCPMPGLTMTLAAPPATVADTHGSEAGPAGVPAAVHHPAAIHKPKH